MQDRRTTELLTDIHRLLDLIECANLVNAREWWIATLQSIRYRYSGTDPREAKSAQADRAASRKK